MAGPSRRHHGAATASRGVNPLLALLATLALLPRAAVGAVVTYDLHLGLVQVAGLVAGDGDATLTAWAVNGQVGGRGCLRVAGTPSSISACAISGRVGRRAAVGAGG